MRRRILLLVIGLTTLVVLAFAVTIAFPGFKSNPRARCSRTGSMSFICLIAPAPGP